MLQYKYDLLQEPLSPVDAKDDGHDGSTSSAIPTRRGLFTETADLPSSDSDSDWEEEDAEEEPDLTESSSDECDNCVAMSNVSQTHAQQGKQNHHVKFSLLNRKPFSG